MSDTATAPERERKMDEIAREAEARAQALIERARAANRDAKSALLELSSNVLMVNGMGKAAKEAHATAVTQDDRLEGLQKRVHEHFNPSPPEET